MMTNGKSYKCLQIRIDRVNKAPLTATWGGISLARNKNYRNIVLVDEKDLLFYGRVERLKAILASECAICGSTQNIQVHHIRALKDLAKRGRRPQHHKEGWQQGDVRHWLYVTNAMSRFIRENSNYLADLL
ncbi:hypothetical protein [Escherichia coli]|uniref:hypothetical protein n=1 Tax=Escherichia coli TaxID=562 RepID=UPI00025C783B|nr:hypothetical protein [Escherichia coli]EIH24358.1 hypothetical protein EC12264_1371 [Escherichia coli 1.2264]